MEVRIVVIKGGKEALPAVSLFLSNLRWLSHKLWQWTFSPCVYDMMNIKITSDLLERMEGLENSCPADDAFGTFFLLTFAKCWWPVLGIVFVSTVAV